ncbi:hypothetical protein CDAR_47201 [Caerostris darwini]|uniref:Ribosomal protein L33 n=1 Tax=Caerostris darwini TaxID=1538125 RepID=A0AAV4SGV0_9ARAC|nr:hypothetical protein CDAR_47201 [Caerostris darwini]
MASGNRFSGKMKKSLVPSKDKQGITYLVYIKHQKNTACNNFLKKLSCIIYFLRSEWPPYKVYHLCLKV